MLGDGKSFGKTDLNILKGIDVERAVRIILKGMHLKEPELIVGRAMYHVLPQLTFISSAINELIGGIAYKNSKESIEKAE